MLATSCAPCGTGKGPIGASSGTVSAGLGEADAERDAADEDAAWLAAGEDAAWLAAGDGDGVVPGLAVLIPTLHAARDKPAAQVATLVAMRRYAFIGCPSLKSGWLPVQK
jgi:hypothetical protein